MPLLISLKNISIVASSTLIILTNLSGYGIYNAAYQPLFLILGIAFGLGSLILSILVTKKGDDRDLDDLIVFNNMLYWLIVGIILTIGSLFDSEIVIQLLILNTGLIVGLFIIFMYIWLYLSQIWKFLAVENIDFKNVSDKDKIPKFLLISLVLGCILAGLFVIFQIIYQIFGFNITSYSFMAALFVFTLTISIILRLTVNK